MSGIFDDFIRKAAEDCVNGSSEPQSLPALDAPAAGDRCPKCGTERAVVGFCATCYDGETVALPKPTPAEVERRHRRLDIAEQVANEIQEARGVELLPSDVLSILERFAVLEKERDFR